MRTYSFEDGIPTYSIPFNLRQHIKFKHCGILISAVSIGCTLLQSPQWAAGEAQRLKVWWAVELFADKMRRSGVGILGRARARTIKMTVTIVLVFFTCWSPYYCYCLWSVKFIMCLALSYCHLLLSHVRSLHLQAARREFADMWINITRTILCKSIYLQRFQCRLQNLTLMAITSNSSDSLV